MRALLLLSAATLIASCYNPDIMDGGYRCFPPPASDPNRPVCPDGYSCVQNLCVKSASGGSMSLSIMKSGPPYTGMHIDPGLNDPNMCPDAALEPNDSPTTAIEFEAPLDAMNPRITKMAICPTGNNPLTGSHDVDYFKINTAGAAVSQMTLKAELFYDISYGDLDIGIFDKNGRSLSTDGTAVSNGCVSALVGADTYYVVVTGANNMDSNRYDLRIRTFTSTSVTCSSSSPDGG
jgi:hypothetical protein